MLPLIISAAVFLICLPTFYERLRFFDLVVSKVFSKEILELRPCYWVFGFKATLMLVLSLGHRFAEKRGGKRDVVKPVSPSRFEIVFTLLAKAAAIQV